MRGKQANAIRRRRIAPWFLLMLLGTPRWVEASQPLPPIVFDFVEEFPRAHIETDTRKIDFRMDEARTLVNDGWLKRGKDKRLAWAVGNESSLHFYVSEPADLPMRFRCRPYVFEGAPEQRVTFVVNGHIVDELGLRPNPTEYRIMIPRTALVAGENRLVFRYAYSKAPHDINPRMVMTKPLAVAWDWLLIGPEQLPSRPSTDADARSRSLIVPMASELEYFTKIKPGTVLTIDDVVAWKTHSEDTQPKLRLEIETEGSARRELTVPEPTAEAPRVIPLTVAREEVARISFRVVPNGSSPGADAGWRLVQPVLRAPASTRPAEGAPAVTLPHRPNIIIYLIDTLRADHLSCYGYSKPTSPNIDAFARDGVRFTWVLGQSSHTKPCVTSIFSGQTPQVHGLQAKNHVLPPATVTLAELIREAGYETAGFSANAQIGPNLGFGQGFDVYELLSASEGPGHPASSKQANARVFRWLDERQQGRPFFLYVHTVDPHSPYAPPKAFRERFAAEVTDPQAGYIRGKHRQLSAADRAYTIPLYDAEIAANDDSFGELLQRLRTDGLYDSSLILLTADHGEEFYEHGRWEHGATLYQEVVHVPLILKLPGQLGAGRTVNEALQQVDILPTLATAAGGSVPPGAEGRNVLPLALGAQDGEQPVVVALRATDGGLVLESAVSGHTKLIRNLQQRLPEIELYDLERDPEERHNVAAEQRAMAGYLRLLLTERRPRQPAPRAVQLDASTEEQLRALGY